MSSILTNASAMTALQTLAQTNKNLATTQNRISTGLRVAEASDNAAYWSIATGMRTQNSVLAAVQDGLGLGKAIVDTAYTALDKSIKIAQDIQAKYVAKETPGTDKDIIEAEIANLKAQIVQIAQSATFQGVNLLKADAEAQKVVTGFDAGGDTPGITTMEVADYDLEAALKDAESSGTVGTAIGLMKAAAAALGSSKTRITTQTEYTKDLVDALNRGIGTLVDADMNAESARLAALQVQQQLGIQGLSIANTNSQNILSLFRN
jgi:flagellin